MQKHELDFNVDVDSVLVDQTRLRPHKHKLHVANLQVEVEDVVFVLFIHLIMSYSFIAEGSTFL
jgi:hypothetical protein